MKRKVSWLHLVVLLTVALMTVFSIFGADLIASKFAKDSSGKLELTIVERPEALGEYGISENEKTKGL